VLHTLRTNRAIEAIKFSPDSKHFAVARENNVFVYRSPGPHTREYSPFVLERVFKGAYDDTTWYVNELLNYWET
jgi:periodic tryptophan protein 2